MTVNIEGLGKITATKDVLNELALAFANSATFHMRVNNFHASEVEDSRSDAIWEQLQKSGYYND